jgi:hypothetical protein
MDINLSSQIKLFANLSSFPLTGEVKTIYIDQATANHYYWSGSAYVQLKDGTKFPTPTGTTSQYLRGDGSLQTFPSIPSIAGLVAKADYTPAHSVLVQQSGTGSPTPVQIGNNEFLGRKTGGGSDIEGLSVSEAKSILNYTASDVGAPSGSGSSTGTNTGDQDLSGLVPTSRNLTINGTTQDLSADRTYSAVILTGQPMAINAGTLGVARYFGFSDNNNSTSETLRRTFLPNDCTLKNFYIRTSSNQPASGSHVLTILKNGVATSITVTIPAGSAGGVFSDTTNSVSFVAGDEISIEAVNNASTSSSTLVSFSIGNL